MEDDNIIIQQQAQPPQNNIYQVIFGFILFCIVFIVINAWIYYWFVPFYKTYLREKIREYIIHSRLDNSGRQIYRNMIEPEKLLQIFQTIEKLFGLDDTPLITSQTNKCIFQKDLI